jgi:hypothetical protein
MAQQPVPESLKSVPVGISLPRNLLTISRRVARDRQTSLSLLLRELLIAEFQNKNILTDTATARRTRKPTRCTTKTG